MGKDKGYYIGFDLGGTKMLASVVDTDFKVVAKAKRKTKPESGADAGMDRMEEVIEEALKTAKIDRKDLLGIGFGLPGVLDLTGGRIVRLPNVGWTDVPIKARFEEKFNVPVVIDNDVNTGTYGEYRCGAGKGHRDIIGIFPGTGIGGGIIINGKRHHGITDGAGEIGHIVCDPSGPQCGCGLRGCYEAYAGRVAISGRAAEAVFRGKAPAMAKIAGTDLSKIKSKALAQSIAEGDTVIEEIVREAAYKIGLLASILIATLSPSMVILGGGLAEENRDIYMEECQRAMDTQCVPELGRAVTLAMAELGDYAVSIGGAAIAADAQ